MNNLVKKPTTKEKIEVYEQLLHDVNYHRTVTGNSAAVTALLAKIVNWSQMHTIKGYPEKEKEKHVNSAFWLLKQR